MKKIALAVMGAALSAASAGAMAYEAGDILVRAGVASVQPDVTDKVAGGAFALDVDDNAQVGLNFVYMLTPQFGVELLAATPFKHDVTAGGTVIGETTHLPPTVTVQWYPKVSDSVQPFVGVGLNYTTFWDAKLNATGKGATGADKLSLPYSTGLAMEAGVDVKVADNVFVSASVWKIDIDTEVRLDGVSAGELQIDPLAYMIGVGYKF